MLTTKNPAVSDRNKYLTKEVSGLGWEAFQVGRRELCNVRWSRRTCDRIDYETPKSNARLIAEVRPRVAVRRDCPAGRH